jgi:hypothetical protein
VEARVGEEVPVVAVLQALFQPEDFARYVLVTRRPAERGGSASPFFPPLIFDI